MPTKEFQPIKSSNLKKVSIRKLQARHVFLSSRQQVEKCNLFCHICHTQLAHAVTAQLEVTAVVQFAVVDNSKVCFSLSARQTQLAHSATTVQFLAVDNTHSTLACSPHPDATDSAIAPPKTIDLFIERFMAARHKEGYY